MTTSPSSGSLGLVSVAENLISPLAGSTRFTGMKELPPESQASPGCTWRPTFSLASTTSTLVGSKARVTSAP